MHASSLPIPHTRAVRTQAERACSAVALSEVVVRAVEAEQARLAQNIHDTLCQSLGGLQLLAHVAAKLVPCGAAGAPEMADLIANLKQAAGELRHLNFWLKVPELPAGGLPAALQELCATIAAKLPCEWKGPAGVDRLPVDNANRVYQMTRQFLRFALTSGKATSATVEWRCETEHALLVITSKGMPPSAFSTPEGAALWELLGHYAQAGGATLKRSSSAPNGTRVQSTWPVF